MAMFELFGVGRGWAGAFKADPLADRRPSFLTESPVSDRAIQINDTSAGAIARTARDRIRSASGALQEAFGGFVRETKPFVTTTRVARAGVTAAVSGMSARVDPIDFDYYGLQTTAEVNSRTSTVRTSWGALGLDTTTPDAFSMLVSSDNLGLDLAGASSRITSKQELHTGVTTSYGSSTLTFAAGGSTSTSLGSLTGTYSGTGKAADATALEIVVTKGGTIRSSVLGLNGTNIGFDVKDQTGKVVFSYNGNVSAGEAISLGNDIGLTLTLAAGSLAVGHAATTTVGKTPITVDPNARFDAAPGVRPQFEAVSAVTAGSFAVNNTAIQVFADDTINTVLDRINNSAAGVTATIEGDKVSLTTKANSEQAIAITGDTSGFVKAVRLDTASTVIGNLRDDERLLRNTNLFKNIRTGSFTVNGRTISIDKDSDTLATVLARINESGAGVTASLDSATNRIQIVSNASSEDPIVVGDDTTGFLGMARLGTANTVAGNIRDDREVLGDLFGGVTSGSFLLNGVAISVNADTDTLSSVISRINGSGAGVTASYDTASDRFTFTPDVAGATLSIEGDTTGLLAALKIASGTAATDANADGAFNLAGAAGPLFDAGYGVHAGSFTVNGVAIQVADDDTINTVLAKITASSAGVIASYDGTTDRVSLTASETGAPVTVGADTSGFLAAVKLDGTETTSVSTVSYSWFNTALGEMAEYAGVTTGTLSVNGHDIGIDPMSTTIGGLVAALNGISGVGASIDQTTGAVRIWADRGQSLTLSDTSGVLDAFGIAAGTALGKAGSVEEVTTTGQSTTSNASEVAAKVVIAVDELNAALDGVSNDALRAALEDVVESLRERGIRGLQTATGDSRPVLAVTSDELTQSLNEIAGDVDLERVLSDVLEELEGGVAASFEAEASPATSQTVSLDMFRTQLSAEQTAGSLLHVRTSLQPHESVEATRKTVLKAYGVEA
jgi:hypothetical protein